MKNKGEANFLASETMKIILAVICLVALTYLAFSLYGIFTEKTKNEQAKASLDNLVARLTSLQVGDAKDFLLESPAKWYLVSFEAGTRIPECGNDFCVCLCDKIDCSKAYECKKTNRFVLLRDENLKEVRLMKKELPAGFVLSLDSSSVYPYNQDMPIDTSPWTKVIIISPLFYRFDQQWKWSPDLKNWMTTDSKIVSGGVWDRNSPSSGNINFINELEKIKGDLIKGEELFKSKDVKLSEGVYIMQVQK